MVQQTTKGRVWNVFDTVWFRRVLFYTAVYLILFFLVYPICPMSDDWYYSTAPNPDFQLEELLPQSTFWRPLDVLFGAFMGLVPNAFPLLNRAVVILAHIVNAILMDCILIRLEVGCKWRRFGVCFFLLHSAVWAVVVSPDALNQAYSVLFGLLALYLHLRKEGYLYLLCCMIATLWKESGISWFFVIPLFDAFLQGKTWKSFIANKKLIKHCLKEAVCSFAVICVYFVVRFLLYGSVALGNEEGRYKISIFSLSTIKNALLLFGSAGSGVDSIALFGSNRSVILAAITGILSVCFLGYWFWCAIRAIFRKEKFFPICCLLLCNLGLALPLMIIGNAGEMHAYSVLASMTILFVFVLENSQSKMQNCIIPILSIFIAFSISSAHKLVSIYDYSSRTQVLTNNLLAVYDAPAGESLFISLDDRTGYSIFEQSAFAGTSKGLSMRPYYGWTELNHKSYSAKSEEDALVYIQENQDQYTSVYIIRDETVQKVK